MTVSETIKEMKETLKSRIKGVLFVVYFDRTWVVSTTSARAAKMVAETFRDCRAFGSITIGSQASNRFEVTGILR